MRNGQNKHRMRGRNRGGGGGGKSHNPLTRVYESNGPDVKIRGTANHVAEKYIQLARDATASGDPVAAENYYQHAEHYFRLIASAQEQFRQSQPYQQRPEGGEQRSDESYEDSDESQPSYGSSEPHSPREQQYQQRDAQPYQQREQPYQPRGDYQQSNYQPRHDRNRDRHQHDNRQYDNRQPQQGNGGQDDGVERLPSFITGSPAQAGDQQNGQENQGDRFPLHRRRRRGHRGPRPDMAGSAEGGDENTPTPSNE